MINVEMYTQMGYTKAQVLRAHQYSQKNRVDMFDALQLLQSQERVDPSPHLQKGVPKFSYLVNLKSLKLNDFEVLYSRNAVKTSQMSREEIREVNNPVGLLNVSNCCYLNSLLQCYFLMGSMTREILQAQPISSLPEAPESRVKNKRIQNQFKLLGALQEIFAKMKLSSKKYLDPTPVLKNLVDSVGEKIEYGDEKDLHEINMCIVERLSECLIYTKRYYLSEDSPSKSRKNENIKKLFYGQKVQYTEGSEQACEVQFLGLILNPKDSNLLTAIDSEFNYDVEIQGRQRKRETYIKTLPEYLFININRTGYEKSANQFIKNEEKMSFDFVIYLDRYLDSNKEKSKLVNPKIIELLKRKNTITHQINHLELLATKLDQCRAHAKYLSGWENRLPEPQELMKEKEGYQKEIAEIEKQLIEIQSRKQKFVLMYLFVHRGDAISGHYWGYGRNGNKWYRFDINCSYIKESEILIDMERSGGTPYAMVYVRDNQIQSFPYPYYLAQPPQQLLDMEHQPDYIECIPQELRKRVIEENILIHKVVERDANRTLIEGLVQDYKVKYNLVLAEGEEFQKSDPKTPNYQNFTLFLFSLSQLDFMKYHIFSMCLLQRSQMRPKELLEKDKLLKDIQKTFRRKMKGKMVLRHYAIECQPEEGKKYSNCYSQYILGKKCVLFIERLHSQINDWPECKDLTQLLDAITPVFSQQTQAVYIKSLVRELVAIMLLDLAAKSHKLRQSWVQASQKKNPLLVQQLEQFQVQYEQGSGKDTGILQGVEKQEVWKLEDLRKGEHQKVIKRIQEIIAKLEKGVQVHKKNTRGQEVVKGEGNLI